MEWTEQAKIFEKIVATWLTKEGVKYSHRAAAEYLGVTQPKYSAWVKSGQRPVAEDMRMLAREHEFSANWLLLGVGDPLEKRTNFEFNPELVDICDTLVQVLSDITDPLPKIAACGGMTTTDLQNCLAAQKLPPITAIANWVKLYRLNANYVLAQIGYPFISEDEFLKDGPGSRIRDRNGDLATLDGINDNFQSYASSIREKMFEYREKYIYAEEMVLLKEKDALQMQKEILKAVTNVCKFHDKGLEIASILYEAVVDYPQWQNECVVREKIASTIEVHDARNHSAAGNE